MKAVSSLTQNTRRCRIISTRALSPAVASSSFEAITSMIYDGRVNRPGRKIPIDRTGYGCPFSDITWRDKAGDVDDAGAGIYGNYRALIMVFETEVRGEGDDRFFSRKLSGYISRDYSGRA